MCDGVSKRNGIKFKRINNVNNSIFYYHHKNITGLIQPDPVPDGTLKTLLWFPSRLLIFPMWGFGWWWFEFISLLKRMDRLRMCETLSGPPSLNNIVFWFRFTTTKSISYSGHLPFRVENWKLICFPIHWEISFSIEIKVWELLSCPTFEIRFERLNVSNSQIP